MYIVSICEWVYPVLDTALSCSHLQLEAQISTTPNYGSDMDEVDSSATADPQRTKVLIEHYLTKIERTKELIKAEQKAKDGRA